MSTEIHVLAILTPAKGKEPRIKELLSNIAKAVEANEDGASTYQLFEYYNEENGNRFILQEIYKSQEAYDTHFKTEHFQVLSQSVREEGLLSAPLDIKTIKPFAGFVGR